MNGTSLVKQISFLLSRAQKRQLLILVLLMFVGMLFEMAGLGVLIPTLGIILNSNIGEKYPALRPLLEFLGNPTQGQLAIWGMILLILLYLCKAVFLIYLTWKQSRFTYGLASDLSRRLFLGYLKQPYTFHLERNSALLLRNIQNEITQFTTVSAHTMILATEFSVILSIATFLIIIEPVGAISVTIFLGLAALVFLKLIKRKLLRWGKVRQFHGGQTNQHLMQGLSGVKDVKILGREDYFSNEFVKHNKVLAVIDIKFNTVGLIPRFYLELLAVVGLAGLIMMMVLQHKQLDQLLPTLGVFVAAAFRMMPSVNRIIDSSQRIRIAVPVINLLYEEFILIKRVEVEETKSEKIIFSDSLSIRGLSFNYPNVENPAVNNITITIKKGESIGLIGTSGSGKSTLVDLILGLLTANKGEILVDGANIEGNKRSWQDQIGYVPQSIYLTDDSLRKNIAFGIPENEIVEERVKEVIQSAQLADFVSQLPHGLETFVGERGVRLSGGQRQRIGIARALYHDPSILVLDEATSALDAATESSFMEAVNDLKGEKTLIIVAHRLSTLSNCNRIYRLENGVVIDEGSPELLLKHAK